MRIIGGKDYYDSASAYGVDPGIVFVRDGFKLTESVMDKIGNYSGPTVRLVHADDANSKIPQYKQRSISTENYGRSGTINNVYYSMTGIAVHFCGKVYFGLEINEGSSIPVTHYFWSFNKLKKWAAERGLDARAQVHFWNRKNDNTDPFRVIELSESQIQAMIENNIAIAIRKSPGDRKGWRDTGWGESDSGWVANCDGLKEIGFQSALDPYTAFQELSMWVGGTLVTNGPNTVTITDNNIKIAKHGFDKFSFRKPKQ